MQEQHPNLAVLMKINPKDLAASADAFAEDVVWHYFNPLLPDIQGDYVGLTGLKEFFRRLAEVSQGTFEVNPVSVNAVGDELVVMHTRNSLTLEGSKVETEVVVVWRIVEGRVTEVWDIPSVHS